MEILPNELVVLLFNTPACVVVCQRFCTLLNACNRDDYYILKVVDKRPVVTKLVGTPLLLQGIRGDSGIITYGRPILAPAGAFEPTFAGRLLVVEGDTDTRLYDICNAVVGFNWFGVSYTVWRIVPGGYTRVSVQIPTAICEAVPNLLNLMSTGHATMYSNPRDYTGTKMKSLNFKGDSSTWSREEKCMSMQWLHSTTSKMLYGGQFAGLADEIPVVVI